MKKENLKKLIIAILAVTVVGVSVLAIVFGMNKTYSAYTKVIVPQDKEVTVYVSGNDVKKAEDGKNYVADPGSTVTVTVVNESKLFESMTINGVKYDKPVAKITLPDSGDLTVSVSVATTEPYAEDNGKYFGNPFVLNKEADVLAVSRILNGSGTESDYEQIGARNKTANDIRYGYYRLGTNLFISSSEFFGLGFRGGLPFGGCFDFDGYTATINLVRTEHVNAEFSFDDNGLHIADYGFFAVAYGDGENPCLIRNAKVQGFIGLNTMNNTGSINHTDRVNAGGVAGTLGKNVVLDGIESTVSVTAQTRFADLYLGGVFGLCSSSVDEWCPVRYDGAFNDVSAVTYGENANAMAGSFAGVIQNASINGVTIDAERSMVLANALGKVSGSAIAGGFAGVIELGADATEYLGDPSPMVIRNITLYAEIDFSVSAVIDNSESKGKANIDPDDYKNGSAAAVSGGIVGIVNRGRKNYSALAENMKIEFSDIYFLRSDARGEDDGLTGASSQSRLMIKSSTQDGNSSGAVYAGGTVGYIFGIGNEYIIRKVVSSDIKYMFECSVDVSAVQNGIGPAYAGGVFGYNAFHFEHDETNNLKLGITSPEYDYTVSAVQSATSTKTNDKYYNVCAGGLTSRFNVGFDLKNIEFHIDNGKITAYREVGSTAIGDVNAGGVAGRVLGMGSASTKINDYDSNPSQSGEIDNVTVYFSDNSCVEASCHSYDSVNETNYFGNNVCAGGAIGYVLGYKKINNLSLVYDGTVQRTGRSAEYFVCGTQNGANKEDNDLKTEGFVGGMFGLVIDTVVTNVNLTGDETENTVVYFTSTNSPNTASVGGLTGALWVRKLSVPSTGLVVLNGATVKNVHSAGKAYCEKDNKKNNYDIYVGGAIGVFANPDDKNTKIITITDVKVESCVVDSIGENTMLTYAGGVVAGMWWASTTKLSYGIVTDSAITASSITPYAYAGGIVGLMQNSDISYCLTQGTEVKAISEQASAYVGGVVARAKTSNDKITYSYSNASLKAQGKDEASSVKYGIIAIMDQKSTTGDATSNASKNFFVYETAGTDRAYSSETTASRALYLDSAKTNKLSVATGGSVRVFSAIETVQSGVTSIKSHDKSIVSVNGLYANGVSEGVAYVSVYCKISGVEYLLCSYPVTVDNATEKGSGITLVTDDGKLVLAQKTDEYIEYTYGSGTKAIKYIYFRRNVGNPDTVKKVNAVPLNTQYLPQTVKLYDITGVEKATYFGDSTTDTEKQARIAEIISAKGEPCDVSAFNGRANVGFNYENSEEGAVRTSAYFYANDNVRENTIIILECTYEGQTYGVIVEFVPNRLTGIRIEPESGTPPLDVKTVNETNPLTGKTEDITHYIYTAGDVVRFSATLTYRYPAPRSYVVETIYGGTGVTTNGMVVVSANGVYGITCEDLKKTVSTYVVVEAKEEVNFSFSYSGGDGTSDRKMVCGSDFLFSVKPQPGYGLRPVISVTMAGETVVGTFTESGLEIVLNSETYVLSYDETTTEIDTYEFVVGSDFVDYVSQNGKNVVFSVTYSKTYSLVFIANYNGNEYFSTTVTSGEKFSDINPAGLDEWTASLVASRYGYDFRGYYTLSKAGDVSAYGKSFEDMQNDGVSAVSGTMRFYARWTYNVKTETPENVKLTSSLSSSMLYDGELIPLDANNGFGFVTETADGWIGKPRFGAFIRQKDGTFIDITAEFSSASQENGYYVSSEVMEKYGSGYIFVKVYADELEFAVGDDAKYDGNALYTDGIFTLAYSVNYGSTDKPGNYTFRFSPLSLPKGTSLRLFYQKNGTALWAGNYVTATAKSEISVSDFGSMAEDGSSLSDELRKNALSEKFIVIITLPDNSNGFGITSATQITATVDAYDYAERTSCYGVYSPSVTDVPDADYDGEIAFVLYPAVIREVTVTGNTLIFTENGTAGTDDATGETITDHRHNGVRYMWRIEKTAGGYVGDATFGGLGEEAVRTTDAIYYYASSGSVTIDGNLSGYTLSLIYARNVKQPAGSPVIFSQSFGE